MKAVSVLSYGVGNIKSVARALEATGASVSLIATPEEVLTAERLVLPGVGAFSACSNSLKANGLWDPIVEYLSSEKPFLGICVGMQLLFEKSEEFGEFSGFGVVKGRVCRLPKRENSKIPLVGWKQIKPIQDTPLFDKSNAGQYYFVHSFAGVCEDDNDCLATYDYAGVSVTAAVKRGAVMGTQFHPEKSAAAGLQLLSRFLEL
ncbi:MAG: imidazole glycerol phosphate synthase subunit HisH [Hyphomicrobiales bacterium]